ncbi:MAG TPA: Ldh family oxidoreductase, partial [Burkholderiaceae bacterium]|nr:Ldh family oxidoreductase [Burkholderiaceae bacterium]
MRSPRWSVGSLPKTVRFRPAQCSIYRVAARFIDALRDASATGIARDLLIAAGLEREMALVVAEVLLEGDLLGHDTHGLALLASYLRELEAGTMTKVGQHRVVEERAASALW